MSYWKQWVLAIGTNILSLLSIGCAPPGSPPPIPTREGVALRPAELTEVAVTVDYAGCRVVWLSESPVCEYAAEKPLRLWVEYPVRYSELSVRVDDEPLEFEPYAPPGIDDEGVGVRVHLPVRARKLSVVVGNEVEWSLRLRPARTASVMGSERLPSSLEVGRGLANSYRAGLAGDYDAAFGYLAGIASYASRYPRGMAELAAYRGQLHWRLGQFRAAALALRRAAHFARRMEVPLLAIDSLPLYVAALVKLGYYDAALRQVPHAQDVVREVGRCNEVVSMLRTIGWVEFELRRHHHPYHDPRPLLEEALEISIRKECNNPQSVAGVLLSLALLELSEQQPGRALGYIEQAYGRPMTADEMLRLRDADLRARRALGRPMRELWASWTRLSRAVRGAGTPEADWLRELRRAQLHTDAEELDLARVAYEQAELHSARLSRLSALGVERAADGLDHEQSADGLIAVLLTQGYTARAFGVAREARARRVQRGVIPGCVSDQERHQFSAMVLNYAQQRQRMDELTTTDRGLSLEARERVRARVRNSTNELDALADEILAQCSRWDPSRHRLQPRGEGELLIGLYPSHDEWFVFVEDEQTIAYRVPVGDGRTIDADTVIRLLGERPARARRIRVLADGDARELELHMAVWRGRPLVQAVPVVYGAELPWYSSDDEHGREALIVADPTRTLVHVPGEVDEIEHRLIGMGWTVENLTPAQSTPSEILLRLPSADLLHYSGHADYIRSAQLWPPYAAGTTGGPAFMELYRGTTLDVQDILVAGRSPAWVVLLGCETGVPAWLPGGASLAMAFLAAGAREVIASPREVSDRVSSMLGHRLYAGRTDPPNLGRWLAEAQAELWPKFEDVGQFRVWVP